MAPNLLTRTAADVAAGQSVNLAAELEACLSSAVIALLRQIAGRAERDGMALYLVGGPVRDLLLEQNLQDFDLVVEGDALQLGDSLRKTYGGGLTRHQRFGTAQWRLADANSRLAGDLGVDPAQLPAELDLISARRERYAQPGALPTVELGSIEEDLARRDFSINTLAVRLDGEHFGRLLDTQGGLADLAAGRLRVLHPASFRDDPTRILRILRFAARAGFEIEEETLALLKEGLAGLSRISGERLRNELDAMLGETQRVKALARADELGVLAAIHPRLRFGEAAASSLAKLPEELDADWGLESFSRLYVAYLLWFQHIALEAAKSVAEHLRLPPALSEALDALAELPGIAEGLRDAEPSAVVAALEPLPLLSLYAVYLDGENAAMRQMLKRYIMDWRHVKPGVDGHELLRRGLEPGPEFGRILNSLRVAWLDGRVSNPQEERALLERLIAGDE